MKYWVVLNSYNELNLAIVAGPKINAIKYIFKMEQNNLIKNYVHSTLFTQHLRKNIEEIFNLLEQKKYIKAYNRYNNCVYELDDCSEYEIRETKMVKSVNYNVSPGFLNKITVFK